MNRTFCKRCGLLLTVLGSFVILALSQATPRNVMKITTRVLGPEPEDGSFAAQPRTLWRAGTKYARIAEAPDTEHHMHGLIIINEPDVWMVNLYNKSGEHIIDPGPSLDVHVPIFQTRGEAKTKLNELEFGREMEFFTANHASLSVDDEVLQGSGSNRYEVMVSGRKVTLWTDPKTEQPIRISLVNGRETRTIQYLVYEELPFDRSLFQPPSGIAIQNSK